MQKNPKPKKKRRKKLGRPRGYSLKRFEETRIGFFLQHEAPVEYQLLKEVMAIMRIKTPPSELIESICYVSDEPLFRKAKFWRSLINYKKYKCRPRFAIETNAEKELYYIRLKLKKYLE